MLADTGSKVLMKARIIKTGPFASQDLSLRPLT